MFGTVSPKSKRKSPRKRVFVGLNKAEVRASVCVLSGGDAEIIIKERVTRVKADGAPATPLLKTLKKRLGKSGFLVAENSYNMRTRDYEARMDEKAPYLEHLRQSGLEPFTSHFNPELKFLTHHFCHAMAALEMAPFEKSIVVVLDGGGNEPEAFDPNHPEARLFPPPVAPKGQRISESCTVYLQDRESLKCVHKEWQRIRFSKKAGRYLADGLGIFYETAAAYVFRSVLEAGKIMGLAPFGNPSPIRDRISFYESLDWSKAFTREGKREWEKTKHLKRYQDVAATVQEHFEESVLELVEKLKRENPSYKNLILTGGCALNCVTNRRIQETGLFDAVYVPPFPGDECIALGAASYLKYIVAGRPWSPRTRARQTSAFGPVSSQPTSAMVSAAFAGHRVTKPRDIAKASAELLASGAILGWFQGRSETGPRALGQRSILADPRRKGLKDYLNDEVKGRESFRPYGCSTVAEKASEYFEIGRDFDSPFMSFAPRVRASALAELREVTHVDGTSRIQTAIAGRDGVFYELLREFGRVTGLYCLLNTSMNVMGEPIVETVEDARRFFDSTPVDAIVVGDYLVTRAKERGPG